MTQTKRITLALLVPAALVVFVAARADDEHHEMFGSYKLLTTIDIPNGGLLGFDISWVDSAAGRYYLADRGTANSPATPRVDVIDTEADSFLYSIPLSTAPNGVTVIRGSDGNEQDRPGTLVVGVAPHPMQTDSGAAFIDLAHPMSSPDLVSTGGNHRADELAYDPLHHIILIANDQDTPAPFISFISTENPRHVTGKIVYDGTKGNPLSTGGIEQPVWDPAKKRFYLAIPSTQAHANGEVDEINPTSPDGPQITNIFPTTCSGGPAGLVLIPGQRLMTSCGDVITIANGSITHTAGVGGDEIWFNRGDDRVYFGGGLDRISVPVVSALPDFNLLTTLTVGLIATPPAPNHTTHSVAADSENNKIFVPVSHEGVKVYSADEDNNNDNSDHRDN